VETGSTSSSAKRSLLDEFLTEYCIFYLIEAQSSIQSESGEVIDVPYTVDGILWDYDDDWMIISDDQQVNFSLLRKKSVAKIDIISEKTKAMSDPSKPSPQDMN
jgi:hypothetical protein